jgi:hypothetical protein
VEVLERRSDVEQHLRRGCAVYSARHGRRQQRAALQRVAQRAGVTELQAQKVGGAAQQAQVTTGCAQWPWEIAWPSGQGSKQKDVLLPLPLESAAVSSPLVRLM